MRLRTRLLDGNFPDYRQLIPPGYPNQLRVGKESLLDALRRVRLLVRDNTTPVRLSMRSGGVELTVVSQEVGHASEDVDAEYEGEELTIAFNPTLPHRRGGGRPRGRGRARDRRRHQAGDGAGSGPRRLPLPPHAGAGVVATVGHRHASPWPSPRCGSPTSVASLRRFVEPDPEGLTVLRGPNGSGKTSVLEAVGWLATQRSFRGAPRDVLVRAGADRAILRAETVTAGRRVLVEAELPMSGAARAQVNRQPVRRRADLAEAAAGSRCSLPTISTSSRAARPDAASTSTTCSWPATPASTPSSTEVDRDPAPARRRAASGRGPARRRRSSATLDVWDDRLATAGTALADARDALVAELGPVGVGAPTSAWPGRRSP